MIMKAKCFECKRKREIVTGKDVCWGCHLKSVSVNSRIAARRDSEYDDKNVDYFKKL